MSMASLAFSQDAPPPSYLEQQAFPDSVMRMPLLRLNGKKATFADLVAAHQGRTVVLDFWASWCKDCIVGLPALNDLMDKTKRQEVDYVFVSLDQQQQWKSAIKRFHIKGEHYRVTSGWNNPLANYIGLDWIPRYVVLDEHGRVALPKAISAGDPKLKEWLLR